MTVHPISLAAAAACVLTLAIPAPAVACGGLFCSGVRPIPVDQSGERILFEVPGEGTVTATVDIDYTGSPEEFSWVLPVPDVLELEVGSAVIPAVVSSLTAVGHVPPDTKCTRAPRPPRLPGMSESVLMSPPASYSLSDGSVSVVMSRTVGPFETELIAASDADALVDWLRANDYLVTSAMEPPIADYVADGLRFLGVKLNGEGEGLQIPPLRIVYPGDEPMIPLALTGVAADPEMEVLVHVFGESRFEPTGWESLEVHADEVRWTPSVFGQGTINREAVSRFRIDEAGGRAFVTELAGPVDDVRGSFDPAGIFVSAPDGQRLVTDEEVLALERLLSDHRYVTRLRTWASGWEMTADAGFSPTDGPDVSATLDLSGRPDVEVCIGAADPVPCADTYCGVGGLCAVSADGSEGCVCPAIHGGTLGPVGMDGDRTVVCVPLDHDPAGTERPCRENFCGPHGTCTMLGGARVCTCDEGYGTFRGGDEACREAVETYEPEHLVEPAACACDAAPASPSGWWALLLVSCSCRRSRCRPG